MSMKIPLGYVQVIHGKSSLIFERGLCKLGTLKQIICLLAEGFFQKNNVLEN